MRQVPVDPEVSPSVASSLALSGARAPSRVDQTVDWLMSRISDNVYRPGTRVPSVRQLAETLGYSRFTIVEAFERLVARGILQARRGSGFYVRPPAVAEEVPRPPQERVPVDPARIDVQWLVRNMLPDPGRPPSPGSGHIPSELLEPELLQPAMRALARLPPRQLSQVPDAAGYLPLRAQLQRHLAEIEIGAEPDQILLTHGITQAIDLIARLHLRPGDRVLVADPSWFTLFGLLSTHRVDIIGYPMGVDGPDLARLESLVQEHQPRLLFMNPVLQNPTGTTLQAPAAYRMLRLAETHQFHIVEDDVSMDLWPPGLPVARVAALDQLQRVYFVSGFTKTLSPNVRVGFIAAPRAQIQPLRELKILTCLATSDLLERVVFKTLAEGGYRKSMERIRTALEPHRDRSIRALERVGLKIGVRPAAGYQGWFDTGVDTCALSVLAQQAGFILAPGALFSPTHTPSTWMRCNFTTSHQAPWLKWLARTLDSGQLSP